MSMRNLEVVKRGAANECSYLINFSGWAVKVRPLSALMLLILAPLAMAQRPAPIQPAPRPPGVQQPVVTSVDPRTDESAQAEEMKRQRNALRQKQLVEKTHELQKLTDELRAEIDKTDKDTLSLDVVKKSEQIEKLAKSIHQLMVTPI
jgi:Skp family chaperone for outer membrane proteins